MLSAGNILALSEAASIIALGVGSTWYARKASHQTKATSNGFAPGVEQSLSRIEAKMERVDKKLDRHLRDHVHGFRWADKD